MTRNLEFSVTVEYLWRLWESQGSRCALSGTPIDLPANLGTPAVTAATASLDRIDNSKGYIEGNVRWVHKVVNIMRNTLTDEGLRMWCQRIVTHGTTT